MLIVAVAEYADGRLSRPAVATAAKEFGALFDGSSHATVHAALVGGPSGEAILRCLRGWGGAGTGLLLWTGHRELGGTNPRLLAAGHPDDWVSASALAEDLADRPFRRWVVVIDACYAYQVAQILTGQLNQVAAPPTPVPHSRMKH